MPYLHIAIEIHNKNEYHIHALVMLFTVFRHTNARLAVHILHDETLKKRDIQLFEKLVSHYDGILYLHLINISTIANLPQKMIQTFTVGSLFRLLVPHFVHEEKVLYLDVDIIIQINIEEIFSINSDNNDYIMAVRDVLARKHTQRLNVEMECYFNSGLILFFSNKINTYIPDFFDQINTLLSTNPHFTFPDQDALNIFFSKQNYNCVRLPTKYNYLVISRQGADMRPERLAGKNLHYVGVKPWEYVFPAGELYWNERQNVFALLKSLIS